MPSRPRAGSPPAPSVAMWPARWPMPPPTRSSWWAEPGADATTARCARSSVGELHAHGIALIPGETTAFGNVGERPVLALPGRLDAALAAGMCSTSSCWRAWRTASNHRRSGGRSSLHKISSTVGLAELVPVRCDGLSATPIASGYVPLSALAQANGWVLITPDSEGYPEASEVVIRPWP